MIKKCYLLMLVTVVVSGLFAQQVPAVLTLEEVIATTLEKNYAIRMAKNEVQIANNNTSLGNAGFLPSVNASTSYDRSSQNSEQQFINGVTQSRKGALRKNFGSSVNMTWTIFDGTRMFATLDKLEGQAMLMNDELKMEVDNSISQLMTNFYQIGFENARLDLLQSNIEFSTERLRIVEEKHQLGKESKMALLQAQVDYNSDQFLLLRQQEILAAIKLQLLYQMAVDPYEFDIVHQMEIDSTLNLNELLTAASNQNPIIVARHTNQQVLKAQMLEAERSKWPQLAVNMGYGYINLESQTGQVVLNQTYDFRYGISATLPLFNGFNQRRELANSKVRMETGKILLEEAEQQIETTILTTYTSYSNNLKLAKLEQRNLDVAKENSEIALERFKLGASSALELREAQTNSVNAQIRYVEALFNAKVAEIQLNRLAGRLTQIY